MNKCIIVVSGSDWDCKNVFQKTIKEKLGYWTWTADHHRELSKIIENLGWDGLNKDTKYQEFYNQLFNMSQEAYNFKKVFINRTVDRFWSDEKAQVLIIKDSDDLADDLKDEDGIFTVYVARNKSGNTDKYDKVIILDSNFENEVKQTIDILLNKETEKV